MKLETGLCQCLSDQVVRVVCFRYSQHHFLANALLTGNSDIAKQKGKMDPDVHEDSSKPREYTSKGRDQAHSKTCSTVLFSYCLLKHDRGDLCRRACCVQV
jgi:hypothetical protein